jgi:hypothetical protein
MLALATAVSVGPADAAPAGHFDALTSPATFAAQIAAAPVALPATDTETHVPLAASYNRLPIRFEPNVGQAPPTVKYVARGGGYSVALTETAASLELTRSKVGVSTDTMLGTPPRTNDHARLRLSLDNARADPELHAEQKQNSVSNYFVGSDRSHWHSNIANYGAIRYSDVYPGIDWIIYGNPHQLEYDFVVAPHAIPRQIRINVEGAEGLSLDGNGDLLIRARNHTVRQIKPLVYQDAPDGTRRIVTARYVVDDTHRQVAFAVDDYDHDRPLIIDPVLSYSTYFGGTNNDEVNTIAMDRAGNIYVAGFAGSADFPNTHSIQAFSGGDAFIAKLSHDGSTLLYSTFLGGSSFDLANAIAVDVAGNAYVTGITGSTDFPTVNPVQATKKGAIYDVFIAKLNASGGALVYSTYLGGSAPNVASAIAVDPAGHAYVVGRTGSTDFPTFHAFQPNYAGGTISNGIGEGFITKLNIAGNAFVYSTYLGGSGYDEINAVAADIAGNAYVAERTSSADFPTVHSLQPYKGADAFVAKLKPDGSALVYSTFLGGSDEDAANAIALDLAGNAYVAGSTRSTDFPTVNPAQAAFTGQYPYSAIAFVAKLDRDGTKLMYSTYLGGGNFDAANAIAVDLAGDAYVAGSAESTDFPIVRPIQATNRGYGDTFVTKLSPAGNKLVYSTYLGGSDTDMATGIVVGLAGKAYVVGNTLSTDFPTANPLQALKADQQDGFIFTISPY